MQVRIDCWNCHEEFLRAIEVGSDPKCRGCGKRLRAAAFDGQNVPANAHAEPIIEPLDVQGTSGQPRFTCPYCGSHRSPGIDTRVSTAGWIVFTILLLPAVGILFCWLGLRIREPYYFCQDCDIRLD